MTAKSKVENGLAQSGYLLLRTNRKSEKADGRWAIPALLKNWQVRQTKERPSLAKGLESETELGRITE
jgi:hypothetical protein